MLSDPVVEEVRRNGALFAEEHDGDVHRMALALRQKQAEHAARLARRQVKGGRTGRAPEE